MEVANPVIDLLSVNAEFSGVKVNFINIDRSDPYVSIDKTRTQQILINLVNNAIKFSPRNTTITVSLEEISKTEF
jgi:signal transduction histidine kinase